MNTSLRVSLSVILILSLVFLGACNKIGAFAPTTPETEYLPMAPGAPAYAPVHRAAEACPMHHEGMHHEDMHHDDAHHCGCMKDAKASCGCEEHMKGSCGEGKSCGCMHHEHHEGKSCGEKKSCDGMHHEHHEGKSCGEMKEHDGGHCKHADAKKVAK